MSRSRRTPMATHLTDSQCKKREFKDALAYSDAFYTETADFSDAVFRSSVSFYRVHFQQGANFQRCKYLICRLLQSVRTVYKRLWCKSQSALAFVADSVRERPVSRAFWQKQISTLLFQLNDLHQNRKRDGRESRVRRRCDHIPSRYSHAPGGRSVP